MPTKTIAYLRVSTEKQADRGVSLDVQRAKLKAYAELYELELVEVIVDAGHSAKSLDRPGLQRALRMLKDGDAEALLVVKLDRLTRSVVDLGTLVERYFAPGKAALLSVGEQIDTRSAAGRLSSISAGSAAGRAGDSRRCRWLEWWRERRPPPRSPSSRLVSSVQPMRSLELRL